MRIVVKVGTSTLAYKTGLLDLRKFEAMVHVLADVRNAGHELIIVSSGAIGLGAGKLGLDRRPDNAVGRQACASVGQCELMYEYDKEFAKYNHTVSQILMTRDVMNHEDRKANVIGTFEKLLHYSVIPIVNENDSLSTEEIFGDNDTLSAVVAGLVKADKLVLLSDIDGLYDRPPVDGSFEKAGAHLIERVSAITPEIECMAGGKGSKLGTGGMVTKLQAARISMENRIPMYLINGSMPEQLYDVIAERPVGTCFDAG